ncbi:MAG: T9SS type A sorting domain-containing protein [Lewinella sp.]
MFRPAPNGVVTISIPEDFRSALVRLLTVNGQLLRMFPTNMTNSNLQALPAGSYLLQYKQRIVFYRSGLLYASTV